MPDSDGKLTKSEKAKVARWLSEKGIGPYCPVCSENEWAVGDHVIDMKPLSSGGFVIGGSSYPVAFVFCKNCFYTRQFLAMPIGLVEKNKGNRDEETGE